MTKDVQKVVDSFVAQFPLARANLFATADAQCWAGPDFCSPQVLAQQIQDCQEYFEIPELKHAAQLWVHTFCGSTFAPLLQCSVASGNYLAADLNQVQVFRNSPTEFWVGIKPQGLVDTAAVQAAQIAQSLEQILGQVTDGSAVRAAPLWAVAADALISATLGAGVQEFETQRALEIAQLIHKELCAVAPSTLPRLEVFAWDMEDEDELADLGQLGSDLQLPDEEPDFVTALRGSCCMIYHSPKAELCNSCPKHPQEERKAAILAYAQSTGF